MEITTATTDDRVTVRRIVDAAALSLAEVDLPTRLAAGEVLLATEADRVRGTLVARRRDGDTVIRAVAVRRRARGQGIGSALVETALRRWGPLTARCDQSIWPFWRANGATVVTVDGDRYQLRISG